MMKNSIWGVCCLLLLTFCQSSPTTEPQKNMLPEQKTPDGKNIAATVAFYNLENLFDTYNNPTTDDDDFTPEGKQKWSVKRYEEKIQHLAEVLDSLGDADGAEIIGLAEVENETVLKDLVAHPILQDQTYRVIHQDMPDPQGLDVALLYKPAFFEPSLTKLFEVQLPDSLSLKARPIVLIKGKLCEEEINILLLHPPFFKKNDTLNRAFIEQFAKQLNVIYQELLRHNPKAKVLIMGDFQTSPADPALSAILPTTGRIDFSVRSIYNPFVRLMELEKGTIFREKKWQLPDQILLSKALVTDTTGLVLRPESAGIYSPQWLQRQKPAKEKGKAWATFTEGRFTGGYSDHFAIFLHLEKAKQPAPTE